MAEFWNPTGRLARNTRGVTNGTDGSDAVGSRESFDVRFWKIRVYKGKRGRTYSVRWTVGGEEFHDTFGTSTLAESRLAELRTYARNGIAFDIATGLPVTEIQKAQAKAAEAATTNEISWYELAVKYVARRWDGLSPNSRRSISETLATITPVLLAPDRGRPSDEAMRHALYLWAFRNQPDPPEETASILAWVAEHSLPLSALADDDIMLDVLAAIARKLDGTRAAANTISRKRAVLSNILDYAVGRGLDTNPLPRAAGMWNSPKTTEGVVDPQVVVNRRQAEELLVAVSYQGRIGPRLVAFFACLYFAGLRPGEAVELRVDRSLDLPSHDGLGNPLPARISPHRRHRLVRIRPPPRPPPTQAPRRGRSPTSTVPPSTHRLPAPPHRAIRHRTRRPPLPGRTRRRPLRKRLRPRLARRPPASLHPGHRRLPLACRPYDLRHACLSTWLNGGVEPTQVAEWAGNSVQVLLKVYAKCIAGRDEVNRRRIEEAFRDE